GGLHPMEVTIAELLKGVGYSTAMYGKWHLGENDERHPQRQGYDEWYGITNTTVPVDPTFPGAGSLDLIQQKILYAKGGAKAKNCTQKGEQRRRRSVRTHSSSEV
ncbi:MAG: sulfatase-like hydrolase/transferase, partial [Deltaproteobacteria bacterium]|nr:sulfatase-like hydrolase/transferase [Deltaproteobacteria bacterium]